MRAGGPVGRAAAGGRRMPPPRLLHPQLAPADLEELKTLASKAASKAGKLVVEEAGADAVDAAADVVEDDGASSSSSEEDDDAAAAAAKAAAEKAARKAARKAAKKAAKAEAAAAAAAADAEATPKKKAKKSKAEPAPETPPQAADDGADAEPRGAGTGTAAKAFQRVKDDEWLGKTGSWNNSYNATFGEAGWGARAQAVLGTVRGKDFRHEKTKKKRGSYRGGLIDSGAVASYKFDSD